VNVWTVLGTKATSDEREVKRAYARKLKVTRPEDDPQAFQELRDAYEVALRMAKHAATLDDDEVSEVQAPAFDYDDRPAYTPAFPQPAAVQDDSDSDSDRVVYTAAYEFDPDSVPLALSPTAQARQIWADFLPQSHFSPRELLAIASASDQMLNLEVRECFELCAIQYCAGEGCPEELREAIAEHFHWESDCSFVHREMPDETGQTLARLRAHRSYQHFMALAGEDEAIRVLLADEVKHQWYKTANSKFTKQMRSLIERIRWDHREMLYFKMNPDVVESWENAANNKRYFFDTAFSSFITGMVLWVAAVFALNSAGRLEHNAFYAFVALQATTFTLFGWFAFKPPAVLSGSSARLNGSLGG
jgi:hypothetical protein